MEVEAVGVALAWTLGAGLGWCGDNVRLEFMVLEVEKDLVGVDGLGVGKDGGWFDNLRCTVLSWAETSV